MKKLLIGSLLLGTACFTQADAREFCGPFAGANFGYTHSNVGVKYNANPADPLAHRGKSHNYQSNFMFGAFGGYSYSFLSGFFLSGEAFVDANIKKKSELFRNENLIVRGKKLGGASFGALGKIGFVVGHRTAAYVGLGAKSDKWGFSAESRNAVVALPNVKVRNKKRFTRLLTEVGFEGYTCSKQNMTWRVSYGYVDGKRLCRKGFPATHLLGTVPGARSFIRYKASDHIVRVGISYRY